MIGEFELHSMLSHVSNVLFENKLLHQYLGHSHPCKNQDWITLHYALDDINGISIARLSVDYHRVSVEYDGRHFLLYVTASFDYDNDSPF